MKMDVMKLIETIRTSTGDVFSFESVCDRLIELSKVQKELDSAIKVLKASVEEHVADLPYENDNGKISTVTTTIYEQDIKAIKLSLPEEVFFRACKVVKEKLSDSKEEKKKFSAIVDLYSTKVGETSYVKVALKELRKVKGTIEVASPQDL